MITEKIKRHDTSMLVDNGSATRIIDYDFFKEIRKKGNRIESSSMELLRANSSQLEVVGAILIEIDDQTFNWKMMITSDLI